MSDVVLKRASAFNSSNGITESDAIIEYDGRVANYCHITYLEVYRGSKQAFVISHEGLFLNERGNIEVGNYRYYVFETNTTLI